MSLGGGQYTTYCDSDTRKTAIDNLRAANIATVISSGNSYYTAAMGAPACISTAVSVGATTKSDVVSSFSNSADILNLLAPGSDILSSIPGGSYASWDGTSMAAPHVAGAWAVLKQAKPNATVTELLKALVSTGKSVTDTRSGAGNRVKPRINLLSAVNSISFCPNCLPDRGGWRATLGQ
jgi:subtilisin family serine protease